MVDHWVCGANPTGVPVLRVALNTQKSVDQSLMEYESFKKRIALMAGVLRTENQDATPQASVVQPGSDTALAGCSINAAPSKPDTDEVAMAQS